MTSPWTRRALSIPLVVAACLLGYALAPALLVLALGVDLVLALRTGRPFMACRLLLFGLFYLLAEVLGLVALFVAWLVSIGRRDRLVASTYLVQRHWARALFLVARTVLSLRFVVEGDEVVAPGPVLVLLNHASLLDTLLPTVFITHAHGLRLRFVLKRELLASPCLDVAGLRLPNVFVDRSSTQTREELARIRRLAEGLGAGEGALLYPEGTRMTPDKRARALAKLAETDPETHAEARALTHVLPPRFGGTLALLDGAPDADCLFLAHHGLEGFAHARDFLRGTLTGSTVRLRFWRVPRASIPADRAARARWLMSEWKKLDASLDALGDRTMAR